MSGSWTLIQPSPPPPLLLLCELVMQADNNRCPKCIGMWSLLMQLWAKNSTENPVMLNKAPRWSVKYRWYGSVGMRRMLYYWFSWTFKCYYRFNYLLIFVFWSDIVNWNWTQNVWQAQNCSDAFYAMYLDIYHPVTEFMVNKCDNKTRSTRHYISS